jgi:methenyltetrahydromethanopterin cyclohydrolase
MSRWSTLEQEWAGTRTVALVRSLVDDAPALEIDAQRGAAGALLIDCGVAARGSWEAGRRIAELAHGGMMRATLGMTDVQGIPLPEFVGDSWRPFLSIHGLQVSFALDEVDAAIRVSGPVRACMDGVLHRPSDLVDGVCSWGVAIVEATRLPNADVVEAIARRAGLRPEELTLVVVPSNSLAGVAQLAGRLNECVVFTLDQSMGLDPRCVVSILGAVPLAPCGGEGIPVVTQDDMIHYAGRATMIVEAAPSWDLRAIAEALVFRSSPTYGRLFSELLAEAGGVFEAIPGLSDLNKVARITLVDRTTGRMASAGAVDVELLASALGRADGGRHGR